MDVNVLQAPIVLQIIVPQGSVPPLQIFWAVIAHIVLIAYQVFVSQINVNHHATHQDQATI